MKPYNEINALSQCVYSFCLQQSMCSCLVNFSMRVILTELCVYSWSCPYMYMFVLCWLWHAGLSASTTILLRVTASSFPLHLTISGDVSNPPFTSERCTKSTNVLHPSSAQSSFPPVTNWQRKLCCQCMTSSDRLLIQPAGQPTQAELDSVFAWSKVLQGCNTSTSVSLLAQTQTALQKKRPFSCYVLSGFFSVTSIDMQK